MAATNISHSFLRWELVNKHKCISSPFQYFFFLSLALMQVSTTPQFLANRLSKFRATCHRLSYRATTKQLASKNPSSWYRFIQQAKRGSTCSAWQCILTCTNVPPPIKRHRNTVFSIYLANCWCGWNFINVCLMGEDVLDRSNPFAVVWNYNAAIYMCVCLGSGLSYWSGS